MFYPFLFFIRDSNFQRMHIFLLLPYSQHLLY
nr:MAG TPA: hypothetical protein [Caudoviricetes sp.]